MSLIRAALGRLFAAGIALSLLALSLGALALAQQHAAARAAALQAPPPAVLSLRDLPRDTPPLTEVNVRAAITAAIDVALPAGNGRLYLLADPDRPADTAQAAVLVQAADLDAFETLVATATVGTAQGGGPVIALNGTLSTPLWIARAERAATEAKRPLAADAAYVRPFLQGRAAGLAPSPFAYAVPLACFALLAVFLAMQVRRALRLHQARHILHGLSQLDEQAEKMAAASARTTPEDLDWATRATRRSDLRQRRQRLQAQLRRGRAAGGTPWPMAGLIVLGGALGLVPPRYLTETLATHLFGPRLHDLLALPLWSGPLRGIGQLSDFPGDMLAQAVILLLGPQSIGMAGALRTLPVTVWIALGALLLLVLQRRAENRRLERGNLR